MSRVGNDILILFRCIIYYRLSLLAKARERMRRSYLRWAGRTRGGSRGSVASTRRKWNSRAHARQLFRSQGILLIRLVTQMTIWFRNCLITSRFLYLFLRFLMINKFYFCYFSAALWGQFKKKSRVKDTCLLHILIHNFQKFHPRDAVTRF